MKLHRLYLACGLACLASTASAAGLLRAQGHSFRWGNGQQAAPQIITYALVSGSFAVPGGNSIVSPDNCGMMGDFHAIVANSPSISPQAAIAELELAFAQWQDAANLAFERVDNPAKANIVVGASGRAAGRAFANLSYRSSANLQPIGKALGRTDEPAAIATGDTTSIVQIEQAYVCLNPAATWKVGFDGNLQVYDLKYTFTHEIGHAIGLDHPGRTGAVMGYRYDEASPTLRESDLAAVRSLYGPNTHSIPPLAGNPRAVVWQGDQQQTAQPSE